MALKYFVVLSILGVAAGFTLPAAKESSSNSDLEATHPAISSGIDETSSPNLSRDKRDLFKKKHGVHSDTVYVNRRYEGSTADVGYLPSREVHYHHYSYPPPPASVIVEQPYQPYYPVPSHDYHHYHGGYQQGYASHGSTYYSGGYSAGGSGSNYHPQQNYGSYGASPPPQQEVSAVPLASGQNTVDRGQGAAAVNNIAIIRARSGSSNDLVSESESKPLPNQLKYALNMLEE